MEKKVKGDVGLRAGKILYHEPHELETRILPRIFTN
jgi:hypothetical protein